MTENRFECKRNQLTIRGTEYKPEGEKLPAVIISHGFTGNSTQVITECRTFASWGYAAYAFDFCGGCADGTGKSDGSSLDMTIDSECADLTAVIEYVRTLPFIDGDRITLMGYSQGGFVSALTAAKFPADSFENLILMSPALCIPDDARAGKLAGTSYDVQKVPEVLDCGKIKISKKYHDNVVNRDAFEEIAPYTGRVLLLHGDADSIVDYHFAIKASQTYGSKRCHLQLVKEAEHGFTPEQTASALTSIRQFLLHHKEILAIDVVCTSTELRKEIGTWRQTAILFHGSNDTDFFTGTILPGAEDVQEHDNGRLLSLRADYTLKGTDYLGQECFLHIVNESKNGEWKPTIDTNSQALDFLNHADLTACLELHTGGLTVRIYSDSFPSL